MERIPVNSSNIASVGYDADTLLLEVEFTNGRIYVYEFVGPGVYPLLLNATSVGKVFAMNVKGQYPTWEVTWERRVQDRITEFLSHFPHAEYGVAHIILSDYNLENRWFPTVIGELNKQKLAPEQYDPAEVEATLVFLKELQAIPEAQRCPVRG